jgi:CAAX prenyl protease N-terminal, five membrane helices
MNGDSSPRKFVRTAASSFFSAEEVARARAYNRPLYWGGAADVALQAGVLAALAWSAADAALDPGSLPWWGRTSAYTAIAIAASAVVRSPYALWSGFIRERRWGFSTQRLRSWAADRARAVAVNSVLTAAALLGLVALARALSGWWLAPAASAFALAALLLSFLAPVVLEPLFNRYSPLQDEALAAQLHTLARQAGVPVRDGSVRFSV